MKYEFTQTLRVEDTDGTFIIWCLLHDNTLDIWKGTAVFEINNIKGKNLFFADNSDFTLDLYRWFKSKGGLLPNSLASDDVESFYKASKKAGKYRKEAKKEFIQLVERAKILGMI